MRVGALVDVLTFDATLGVGLRTQSRVGDSVAAFYAQAVTSLGDSLQCIVKCVKFTKLAIDFGIANLGGQGVERPIAVVMCFVFLHRNMGLMGPSDCAPQFGT